MAQPFLSQIEAFAFNFPPKGWAFCNGQILPINQNQALFSLLGTTYGGNGQTTFALPNLQGRVPIHFGQGLSGQNFVLGQLAGAEAHALTINEMPQHLHPLNVDSTAGAVNKPTTSTVLGLSSGTSSTGQALAINAYSSSTNSPSNTLDSRAISSTGGSQPHENRQPYLTLTYCIALVGIFPSRN
jgi:microcystin-dependent protein